MRTPGECEDVLNVEVYLELEAHGEVLRPERAACRNRAWRASQDVLQSSSRGKFPLEIVGRVIWRRGKYPEARLCCRVLSNGRQ